MSSLSSCKGSPSHDRISLLTDDSLPRDYSLVSITSTGSQQSDEYFKSRDHAESTLRRMQNYLENDQLCDVTLVAGLNGKRYVTICRLFSLVPINSFRWSFKITVCRIRNDRTKNLKCMVAIFGI